MNPVRQLLSRPRAAPVGRRRVGGMSRLAPTTVDVHLVQTSGAEWEVRVDPTWDCVGYITRCDIGFEAIDVLPPYDVALVPELDEAFARIRDTLSADDPVLAAFTAVSPR